MSARRGLPVLHELASRWVFRGRLLAALGAEPDPLTDPDDDSSAAGADRQRRMEVMERLAVE